MKVQIVYLLLAATLLSGSAAISAKTIQEPFIPAIAGLQSKAMLLGFAKNQYDLGMAYYDETKIPRNTAKAIEWLTLASEKNYAPAKVTLAKMLLTGDGVKPNQALAMQLLQQAVGQGDEQAKQILKNIANVSAASQQYSAVDQTLLCKGWHTQNMTIPFFLEQLSRDDVEGKAHKNIETQLKQNYIQQDVYKYYPEYKDAEGDIPYIQIFLPKNVNTSLFNKIELTNHYGYGFNFEGTIRPSESIEKLKKLIEDRDKIQLKQLNAEQFNRDLRQMNLFHSRQNYDAAGKITEKLTAQFQNSYLIHKDNLQSLYFASKPRDADNYFWEFIYLTKLKNGNVQMICGVTS
ncbi:tetratricopeptide repeat protein [Acinetobacter wanghuae]|nr:SEL1-like repeat protein [Acinetobacter wanghuae]